MFPRFPQIATAGTGGSTGGTSITGLNGAVIRQVVFKPGDATTLAAVMEFTAGGRAVASSDGGTTWSTLYDIGGAAFEWWNGLTSGSQWITSGSGGAGNWLLGRSITSFSSSTTLTGVTNSTSTSNPPPQSLGPADFGWTNITGSAGVSAITGIPGTDYAVVATYDGRKRKFHALRFEQAGPNVTATLTQLAELLVETEPGNPSNDVAVRMAYCGTGSSVAASVRDKLFIAVGGIDLGSTGGRLVTATGVGAAAAANNFTSVSFTDVVGHTTGDYRDVAANCATGTVWVARNSPNAPATQVVGILKSTNGGTTFAPITLPSGVDVRPFQQVVVIDFNKVVPRQVVALSRNGDVLRTNDDGATWTIVNDTSTASCVVTTSPCGRSFGAQPGDFTFPPASSSGGTSVVANGAAISDAAVSASTPGVMGSSSGMFSLSSGSTASLSNAVMALDAPLNGATITATQSFPVSGWALDLNVGSGVGIDDLHVYAYPLPSGTAVFLGQGALGGARGDVGGAFGAQFTNSGFSLTASGLPAGTYRIVAFAQSVVSGSFNASALADVTVSAAATNSYVTIDTPASGATLGQAFTISGWAVDLGSSTGTGIDTIHVWAFPIANGILGSGTFLGVGILGGVRPDVGAVLGNVRFNPSGYTLSVSSYLSPGTYRVIVFGRSTVTGAFTAANFKDVTVAADPLMALDTPGDNTTRSQPFQVSGWAVDRAAATGTGVDAVVVYAFRLSGSGTPTFASSAGLGGSRPDVGAIMGAQFANSGYSLTVSGLTPGQYQVMVFARSTVTGTFNAQVVNITVLQ